MHRQDATVDTTHRAQFPRSGFICTNHVIAHSVYMWSVVPIINIVVPLLRSNQLHLSYQMAPVSRSYFVPGPPGLPLRRVSLQRLVYHHLRIAHMRHSVQWTPHHWWRYKLHYKHRFLEPLRLFRYDVCTRPPPREHERW